MFQIISWILSWFSGGPLSTIAKTIENLYVTKTNSTTELEKAKIQESIDRLHSLLEDQQNARIATRDYPWWMAIIAFLFGIGFSLHTFFIAMGTAFQPIIVNGWFNWWLHIPKLPEPYATYEYGIIGFFYGSFAVIGGAKAVANAISKRK